ncbi:sensor histidine kinase [Microlunatus soli]|uniref:Histidine kinase n=1 Tax=Microlunatus soli TaxID=630515 RepID=A0A1H1NVG8_9ACTN|nr:GAF domain-containing protein [Microlunatus soli]SDS02934.1 Histidine kinase [Microlunatus soli]
MSGQPDPDLRSSDGQTSELDELIDQIVDPGSASDPALERLRSLVLAIETISSDLSLEQVLLRLTDSARTLSGARYAALGVISEDRRLERFLHVGIDAETVAEIGHLPEGKGLLGALIDDPVAIRLRDLTDDPRSVGFPPNHPPMDSFLGVPIHVRDEVYGNLYLANSSRGEFSAADEELVRMLAGAAGNAISNARVYQEAQLQQRWLQASNDVHGQLFSTAGEDPLHVIAQRTIEISDADLVSVALLAPDRATVVIEYAIGEGADNLLARRFSLSDTLAGSVITTGSPVMARDGASLATQPVTQRIGVLDTGPIIVLPLGGPEDARGVLSLARRRGRHPFTTVEMSMAAGFAAHASIALEIADARDAEQKMIMLEDRQRIARDLHDHVIQELFGVGLSLESIASRLGDLDPNAELLRQRVDDLDRAIRRIRTSIFALHSDARTPPNGLRQQLLAAVDGVVPALGFRPSVAVTGLVEVSLGEPISGEAVDCVRQLLGSVVEHAQATDAAVEVKLDGSRLTITVTDNGPTPISDERTAALTELAAQAERRRGRLTLSADPGGGTVATWSVEVP